MCSHSIVKIGKSDSRQCTLLGRVEIIASHGTFIVNPRSDNDLIELIATIPGIHDGKAEVEAEKPDELLIVHGTDLFDVRLKRIPSPSEDRL